MVTDDHAGIIGQSLTHSPGSYQTFSGNYIPTSSPSTNTVIATGDSIYLSQIKQSPLPLPQPALPLSHASK